ncbi:hypothetical protein [Streptomyces viridochromogenes]|uniref:hypothetical protein n=1 Tax=Streptomyces viridochromogenes TaxID=1938 RepID=UPI000A52E470
MISHLDKPTLAYRDDPGSIPGRRLRVFQDDAVRFFGQPGRRCGGDHAGGRAARRRPGRGSYDVEQPSTDLTRSPAVDGPADVRLDDLPALAQPPPGAAVSAG